MDTGTSSTLVGNSSNALLMGEKMVTLPVFSRRSFTPTASISFLNFEKVFVAPIDGATGAGVEAVFRTSSAFPDEKSRTISSSSS